MSRDRDRILEQALKHELSAAGTAAGACLDAETLGAWTDGGLEPAAMAAAEVHVSNCARCQALAGTIVKSAPGPLGTPGTPRTLSFWKWGLAPLAAGVTAVTLWTVIPEQQQIAVAPPVRVAPEVAVDQKPQAANETAPPASFATGADRERSAPVDALAAGARAERQQGKMLEERKEEAPKRQLREGAALADAAVPAAAPAAPPPPQLGAVAAESAARPSAPAVSTLQKTARQDNGVIEIPTLDPALGWRIVGGNRIERSEDGGRTWKVMLEPNMGPSGGITAGSAPSNSVGWFVGRGGYVLLTVNGGASFLNMSLAEPLDLASVAAIDARNASVYSVAGRRFRTDDGGRTWRPF